MTRTVAGWHFLGADGRLRDGALPPPDGVALVVPGPVVLCRWGLHASVSALDALGYAPGPIVCRVTLGGEVVADTDKLVATVRTIAWRADATAVLRAFARACATDVLHLWDAPAVVRQYLATGDPARQAAAWAPAYAAAAAAGAAAWAAAWAAADAAADAAAARAVRTAAWAAARARQAARLDALLMALAPAGGGQ